MRSLLSLSTFATAFRHHHSVTSDTAFQGTRKGLKLWFLALYLIVSSKQGLSAKELKRQLRLVSYKTAWTWLHKLRRCTVDHHRAPLEGLVEVDESYIGGPKPRVRGRGAAGKTAVACAMEKNGGKTGRVRLAVIENCSWEKLQAFVKGQFKEESTVHSDGCQAHVGIEKSGYAHIRDVVDSGVEEAHVVLPMVHRVFSLLKRWLLGTHQGSASRKHLQRYLSEFEFRFNRRTSHAPAHLFQRLMAGVVRDGRCPYRQIVGRTVGSAM